MPSFCFAPLRPATYSGHHTGLSATNFFQETAFQWRRCVLARTSTAPCWRRRGASTDTLFTPRNPSCGSLSRRYHPLLRNPASVQVLAGLPVTSVGAAGLEPATIPAQTDTPASSTFQPMVKCSRRLPCPSSLAVWLSVTVKTRSLRHR